LNVNIDSRVRDDEDRRRRTADSVRKSCSFPLSIICHLAFSLPPPASNFPYAATPSTISLLPTA